MCFFRYPPLKTEKPTKFVRAELNLFDSAELQGGKAFKA